MRPANPRYWLRILLFVATIFTTLVVGAKMEYDFQNNVPMFSWAMNLFPSSLSAWVMA